MRAQKRGRRQLKRLNYLRPLFSLFRTTSQNYLRPLFIRAPTMSNNTGIQSFRRIAIAAMILVCVHGVASRAAETAAPPAMPAMGPPPAGQYQLDKSHASLLLRVSHILIRRASAASTRT